MKRACMAAGVSTLSAQKDESVWQNAPHLSPANCSFSKASPGQAGKFASAQKQQYALGGVQRRPKQDGSSIHSAGASLAPHSPPWGLGALTIPPRFVQVLEPQQGLAGLTCMPGSRSGGAAAPRSMPAQMLQWPSMRPRGHSVQPEGEAAEDRSGSGAPCQLPELPAFGFSRPPPAADERRAVAPTNKDTQGRRAEEEQRPASPTAMPSALHHASCSAASQLPSTPLSLLASPLNHGADANADKVSLYGNAC